MKLILVIWFLVGSTAVVPVAQTIDVAPPTTLTDIAGDWVGQCENGDLFRLRLDPEGKGGLSHISPTRSDDEVTLYEISNATLRGNEISVLLRREKAEKISLVGSALPNAITVRVKGLYHRATPQIRFARADAWKEAGKRLRLALEP